jgi:hypothetical protein
MTAEASFGVQLAASLDGLARRVGGLCDRMDRDAAFIQRANQAYVQVPFIINTVLSSGAVTLNPVPNGPGPDLGYFWSIRKLSAVGFTAGTVNLYVDNTGGEPIVPFPQTGVFTFGKGEQVMNPGSTIALVASGITGTVQIWGKADQIESWLWPWYIGAQRDDS